MRANARLSLIFVERWIDPGSEKQVYGRLESEAGSDEISVMKERVFWVSCAAVAILFLCTGDIQRKTHAGDIGDSARMTALELEVNRLKGLVPDQSHAMKDVAYHFANLWFAGEKKNWSLADCYWS